VLRKIPSFELNSSEIPKIKTEIGIFLDLVKMG
jgi:hypothetical protein